MILLGDFNAKSKPLTVECTILENLTSLYGMKQLLSAPTHNLQHTSSCIDFFCRQVKLTYRFWYSFIAAQVLSSSSYIQISFQN